MNDEDQDELIKVLNIVFEKHKSICLDAKEMESLLGKERINGIIIKITKWDYISIYPDIIYPGYELADYFLGYVVEKIRQNNKVIIWNIELSFDNKRYQFFRQYITHGDILHIYVRSITELENDEYLENAIGIIKLVQLKHVVVSGTGTEISEIINELRFIKKVTGTKVYYAKPWYRGYDYEDVDQSEDQD